MGSFFRYPGGKGKLAPPILWAIEQIGEGKPLIEACCGSAAIGVQYAKRRRAQPIWLNDRDPGIAALWRAAIHRPAELKALIRAFKPSLEAFATFQSELLAGGVEDECEHGFKKLALHQMSYSGLGLRAGGPMGDIGCRWSPDRLCECIDEVRYFLAKASVTSMDFEEALDRASGDYVIYLDPPYLHKGSDLFHHGFSEADHIRLCECLKRRRRWVLSYDDCPEIRAMYGWAWLIECHVEYSITTIRRKKELIICPPCSSLRRKRQRTSEASQINV